ncbi:MAG TPA: hypothetical protein VL563_15850 [Gemmatimonadales bacterium]|nr:hypothetical protein [Gemmatimonadales bacterium]
MNDVEVLARALNDLSADHLCVKSWVLDLIAAEGKTNEILQAMVGSLENHLELLRALTDRILALEAERRGPDSGPPPA